MNKKSFFFFKKINAVLTYPITKKMERVSHKKPVFFLPLAISNSKTPKLTTSDFTEKRPSRAYSGDI